MSAPEPTVWCFTCNKLTLIDHLESRPNNRKGKISPRTRGDWVSTHRCQECGTITRAHGPRMNEGVPERLGMVWSEDRFVSPTLNVTEAP